jgi:hypothetical protein
MTCSPSPASKQLLRGEIPPEWNVDDILQLRELLLAAFAIPEQACDNIQSALQPQQTTSSIVLRHGKKPHRPLRLADIWGTIRLSTDTLFFFNALFTS